jgi:tetratricopeptide (TPR) repeat protein
MSIRLFLKQSINVHPKLILLLTFLSGVSWCLPIAVQSKSSSFYGLDIKPQFSPPEIYRCPSSELIAVDLLAPDNGGRTLAARPTFYWYIEHKSVPDNYPKNKSKPAKPTKKINISFLLRDGVDRSTKSIFRVESKATQVNTRGKLYKLTLPSNSPLLDVGKIYSWQIRYTVMDDSKSYDIAHVNARTFIKRESNQSVMEQINTASTDLLKARIYAHNAYWYDAIDSYSRWIDANPRDQQALNKRMAMLNEIIDRQQKIKCATKFNAIDIGINMMKSDPLDIKSR